jgi:hypothetical protein
MPGLYPNVPFYHGQQFDADYMNVIANPVFDDATQYLGHLARIKDTDLSNDPTHIKARLTGYENVFKCAVQSGLNVTVNGGIFIAGTTRYVVPNTVVTVPNNSVSFIYLNNSGVPVVDIRPDVLRLTLAKITAASGTITLLEDYRGLADRRIITAPEVTFTFGGQHSVDRVCTQGEVLIDGLYYCRDFIVPAGITITVDKFAIIKCSGKAVIDGTVNVTTFASGAFGINGFTPASYTPSRAGVGAGTFGVAVGWGVQPFGSGGRSGAVTNTAGLSPSGGVTSPAAGNGGGGFQVHAAKGIEVRGVVIADASNAGNGAVADTSAQSTSNSLNVTGSSGGSGGVLYFASPAFITFFATAVLSVKGGNGGNAATSLSSTTYPSIARCDGGGGGSGGWIVTFCPPGSFNNLGATYQLTGGTAGTAASTIAGATAPGGAGGAGTGGQAHKITTDPLPVGSSGQVAQLPYLPLG